MRMVKQVQIQMQQPLLLHQHQVPWYHKQQPPTHPHHLPISTITPTQHQFRTRAPRVCVCSLRREACTLLPLTTISIIINKRHRSHLHRLCLP